MSLQVVYLHSCHYLFQQVLPTIEFDKNNTITKRFSMIISKQNKEECYYKNGCPGYFALSAYGG